VNVEVFKVSIEIGWPVLKGFFSIIGFYFIICIGMGLVWGRKALIVKKMFLVFKVAFSLMLFASTLLFQYNPEANKIFFDWPNEITLIQFFLLPIILIEICLSLIEIFTPEKY